MTSPSAWRVWIEIVRVVNLRITKKSPSAWRVWIEMFLLQIIRDRSGSHPPHGGCGLK